MATNKKVGLAYSTSDESVTLDGKGNIGSSQLTHLLGVLSTTEGSKAVLVSVGTDSVTGDDTLQTAVVKRDNVIKSTDTDVQVNDTNVMSASYVDANYLKSNIKYAGSDTAGGVATNGATKLVKKNNNTYQDLNVGSTSEFVYFANGVPTVAANLSYEETSGVKKYAVKRSTTGSLYVSVPWDTDTDSKVTQSNRANTDNNDYQILLSPSTATPYTGETYKSSSFKFNPSTGNLQVTKINGANVGNSPAFTDTKVTSRANHYSPETVSGSEKTKNASGGTAAWGIDVVKGITISTDGKGHITDLSVSSGKIPTNPNTDTITKVQVSSSNTYLSISESPTSFTSNSTNTYTISANAATSGSTAASYSGKLAAYNSSGNLNAMAFYANSDRSLKKNITDLTKYDLDKVSELPIVEFDWKSDGRHSVGVIAQDIEEVIPEAVSTSDSGLKSVNYTTFLLLKVAALEKELKELKNKLK